LALKNIEKLKLELEQAQTYYNFWTDNRHLPTAAQSADYFASRLAKLRKEIENANTINQPDSNHRDSRGTSPNEANE